MTADEQFIRRAIRLAMNGRGKVEPNPMVGCVLVKDGRVIGEGYHTHFGGPHAEPTALASCTESPEGATAYVTLEPCCHTNKKTPPCAPRLIHEKIARVVVGCLDPNPFVNGKGLRMLRDAGIRVDGPLLEAECKQLIAPFLASQRSDPYSIIKWAESADGRVAGAGGRRRQISNPKSSQIVQELRSRCGGILVGINTVLSDDPTLLPRGLPTPQKYLRIVVDTHLRIPVDCQLARTAKLSDVVVLCASDAGEKQPDRKRALTDQGVIVHDDVDDDETGRMHVAEWFPYPIAPWLHGDLLIEPGPTLAATMLPRADRLWVIRSPNPIGETNAPRAPAIPTCYVEAGSVDLDGDRLTEYLNTGSRAFFAPVPSADFVLTGSSRSAAE